MSAAARVRFWFSDFFRGHQKNVSGVSVHLTLPNRATDRSLLMPSSRSGRRAPWTKLQKVPLKTNNHFISKLGVFGQSASRSVNRLLKNPVLRPTFNQVVLCCVFSARYLSVCLSLSVRNPAALRRSERGRTMATVRSNWPEKSSSRRSPACCPSTKLWERTTCETRGCKTNTHPLESHHS